MIRGVHHVGIVVASLAQAEAFVSGPLGLELSRRLSLPDVAEIAFYRCGEIELELIEVRDPDARRTRLGPEGTVARIEHVALEVEDLLAAAGHLRGSGVRLAAGAGQTTESDEPLVALNTRSLFSIPGSAAGLTLQFIEPLDDDGGTRDPGP